MGIQGLLPFLKKIHTPVNIAQFQGCTVAIDAYCWLHKGAFSCAEKLALKEDTDQYVFYCMKYINYMLNKGIKPVLVFDGCHLESKAGVEKTRRERRDLHRKKAAQLLREGKRSEAKECLQRCIDITPQMALRLIQACRDKGVDCIVAPYEADAQLAYLNLSGIAQIIVTEDSDLLLFGCEKVIFKMDFFGNGTLIEKSRLNEVMAIQGGFYTFDKFRHMCILSGCDYLASLPGIGLGKSNKVFKLARLGDVKQLLKKLPTYLKMNLVVSEEYVDGFMKADNTFLYQLVFDPLSRSLKPLHPHPPELEGVNLSYAGHHIAGEMAYQIALGNIDIHNLKAMDYFDPDTFVAKNPQKPKHRYLLSIWDKNYKVKSQCGSPCKEIQPSAMFEHTECQRMPKDKKGMKRILSPSKEKQDFPPLKISELSDLYRADAMSPKKGEKRLSTLSEDHSDKDPSRKESDMKSLDAQPDLNEMIGDENDNPPPPKRPKIKHSPKFKYNAANIGEETFKEGVKEAGASPKTNRPKSRNVFAISKPEKQHSSTVESRGDVKSKYFNSYPPKSSPCVSLSDDAGDAGKDKTVVDGAVEALEEQTLSKTSKVENIKPLSLKEMFKKLKEKKCEEEDNTEDKGNNSVHETPLNEKDKYTNNQDNKKKGRTPSAFCWSKFKFGLKEKHCKSESESPGINLNEKKSVSENRQADAIPPAKGAEREPSSVLNLTRLKKFDSKHKELPSKSELEFDEVKELKLESYESFMESFSKKDREITVIDIENPEKDEIFHQQYEEESPFPKHRKVEGVENDDVRKNREQRASLSQGGVKEDLTISNHYVSARASEASKSSTSSGNSRCRVSGLSKRKDKLKLSKKSGDSKSDSNQKSIKDLFSKFSFKRSDSVQQTKVESHTHITLDSSDEEEEGLHQDTPTSKLIHLDAAFVRRKLKL